jgi:hypothetical protein
MALPCISAKATIGNTAAMNVLIFLVIVPTSHCKLVVPRNIYRRRLSQLSLNVKKLSGREETLIALTIPPEILPVNVPSVRPC